MSEVAFHDEIVIEAPPDAVWSVYADVERWPEWTASVGEVRFISGERVAPGARVRIRQPKLPAAKWEVVTLEPGRAWTWQSRAPGVRTTAIHTLEPLDAQRTRVCQSIVWRGMFAGLVGRLYAKITRSYLAMEAAGLKQRCEAIAHA